jgi:hypothetical protein
MPEKKIWGRKRHVLVESQGSLLAVKVTGAERSEEVGGRMLLLPLKEKFPRMKLLWGDSHYAGQMITWLKLHLGWILQPVRALTVPKRGLVVPEGSQVEWDTLFPKGFRPLPVTDGWSSAALPGSPDGAASAAIMRDSQQARRPSSSSRRAIACSPGSLHPSHRDRSPALSIEGRKRYLNKQILCLLPG